MPGMGAKRGTPEERLLRRTEVDTVTGCWVWQGAQDGHGYGQIAVGGRPEKVYRLSYRIFIGEIPEGLSLDHLCRNRLCLNPEHLEAVTYAENNKRSRDVVGHPNANKTHCPAGHPYDDHNTRYLAGGKHRVCGECRRKANREYRARKKVRNGR